MRQPVVYPAAEARAAGLVVQFAVLRVRRESPSDRAPRACLPACENISGRQGEERARSARHPQTAARLLPSYRSTA